MANLGVTLDRVYTESEAQDYGWGLGQFSHTNKGVVIFVKIGADITAGTATYVDPATFATEASASGDLTVMPQVSHTYSADSDAYAFVLVSGYDDTNSAFFDFAIVA